VRALLPPKQLLHHRAGLHFHAAWHTPPHPPRWCRRSNSCTKNPVLIATPVVLNTAVAAAAAAVGAPQTHLPAQVGHQASLRHKMLRSLPLGAGRAGYKGAASFCVALI
jgi:hypothetical protein